MWPPAMALLLACQSGDKRAPHFNGAEKVPAPSAEQPLEVGKTSPPRDEKPTRADDFDIKTALDAVSGETQFLVTLEKCSFEARAKVEGAEMLITRHSNCALSPAAYVNLWRQVLREAISTFTFGGNVIHLIWGRLAAPATDAMAPIMSHRLAASIRKTKAWDSARGKLKEGQLENFIREQARPEVLFPELIPVAREHGFAVETEHVEMVLVGGPDNWPSSGGTEFSRDDKLPYDAQIVFILNKLPQ
jgi:hypothetical protein